MLGGRKGKPNPVLDEEPVLKSERVSVHFRARGNVHYEEFKRRTKVAGELLGLRGWCGVAADGVVEGVVEGFVDRVHEIKSWMELDVSPCCGIDRFEYSEETPLEEYSYTGFVFKN